jgi:hypothetical protein
MIAKVKQPEQHLQRKPTRVVGTADRHLWEIAAVRDLFVLLLVASLLWVVYRLNDVFLLVFLALILADVINPNIVARMWLFEQPV